MAFYIMTDVAADLPKSYADKWDDFRIIPMNYQIDGEEKVYECGNETDIHQFYERLRNGSLATTSQIMLDAYLQTFGSMLKNGDEILYICFSSGLSGTYETALMAQKMLSEEISTGKLVIVDSLCASVGEGLLVHYALEFRKSGMNIEQVAEWVVNHRQNIVHWFTVTDLNFLKRGGRISATSAALGSMLKIKPVMDVNFEGKLIAEYKVQGRKKSLKELVEQTVKAADPKIGPQTIFIGHGDCEEDAQFVLEKLKEEGLPIKESMITPIGTIIGSHSGPGTLALFSYGKGRYTSKD